jgi:hypothetical protein
MSDIDELVKRLREHPENDRPGGAVCQDAADVLERQQRDLKEAVELLRRAKEDGWKSADQVDAFLARVKL